MSVFGSDKSLDAATEAVTNDENVLHLEMLHRILQSGRDRRVSALGSQAGTRFATFRTMNASPGFNPRMVAGSTRESEHAITMYCTIIQSSTYQPSDDVTPGN